MAILAGHVNLHWDTGKDVAYLCGIATGRVIKLARLSVPGLSRAITESSEAKREVL
jgi:hypothetical protein